MNNNAARKFQFKLEQNVGFMDRQIRGVIGAVMIIGAMLISPEAMGIDVENFLFLASIPIIASAIIGWDPFYAMLGVSKYVEKEENIQQRNWSYSNLGIVDRVFRFVLGTLLLMGVLMTSATEIPAAATLFAIPLILSAMIAWDPIYAMFDLNSFATRADVEVAEPGSNEKTLARYYEFPGTNKEENTYSKAA